MSAYSYVYPRTLAEVLQVLSKEKNVRILAGGTEILPRLRKGLEKPGILLDISRTDLNYIKLKENRFAIGAATLIDSIEYDHKVRHSLSALAEAAFEVGGVQTRNLGTIGGNICMAIPSADLVIPLLVFDAMVKIRSLAGEKKVPLESFFLGPRRTILAPDEIVTEISVETPPEVSGSAFYKIGRRKAMRLSVLNAAAYLEIEDNVLKNVRLAMGTVAPVPLRLHHTETFLTGRPYGQEQIAGAARILQEEISPRDSARASAWYRREIAPVVLERVITRAYERAVERGNR